MMQPPANNLPIEAGSIVLAGASVRAAARSARRAGFRVTGIDFFGDLDTLQSCDKHINLTGNSFSRSISESLAELPPGTPLFFVGGLGATEAGIGTAIIPLDNLRVESLSRTAKSALKNPLTFADLAAQCDLSVPESLPATVARQFERTAKAGRHAMFRPWLVKWLSSSGGLGVAWHRADSNFLNILAKSDDWILQRWTPGRSVGVSFFADSTGVHKLGAYRSLFTRHDCMSFLYAGSVGPIAMSSSISDRLTRFAAEIATTYNLRGLFNIDVLLQCDECATILEINPRWTAASELVEIRLTQLGILSPGDSLLRWHVLAHSTRDYVLPASTIAADNPKSASACFKRVIYANRSGRFDIANLAKVANTDSVAFADLPPPNRIHRAGEPLLTAIALYEQATASPHSWRRMIRDVQNQVQ